MSGSRPSCAAWITAANTDNGSHSPSSGLRRKAVNAMRLMRSPFKCFGSARLISGSHFVSIAGKFPGLSSFGGCSPVTAVFNASLMIFSFLSV